MSGKMLVFIASLIYYVPLYLAHLNGRKDDLLILPLCFAYRDRVERSEDNAVPLAL